MKTFAIVGCGHLGKIIKKGYELGLLEDYKLIAAYSRKLEDSRALVSGLDAKATETIDELISLKPDFILETASIALLKDFAIKALKNGCNIVPLSIGAFADAEFRANTYRCAKENNVKIYIPSGAVGGFDVLSTISLIAEVEKLEIEAGIHTHKGPNSLKNTPLYSDALQEKEETVFAGSTKDAIALLPTKVNVAIATSLATLGPEKTKAQITSVPEFLGDDHKLEVETDGLKAIVDVYSRTSDIAGWSVVALLRNLSSPIELF